MTQPPHDAWRPDGPTLDPPRYLDGARYAADKQAQNEINVWVQTQLNALQARVKALEDASPPP